MTFPFTPHTSFTDDATPAIGADFLMALQSEGVGPAAAVSWKSRPLCSAYCTDGSTIVLSPVTAFCQDATTSKFGFATLGTTNVTVADLEGGGSFPTSSWLYVYLKLDNGTASAVISTTGPDGERQTKAADQTLRFLFSFRTDSGGNILRFSREGRVTHWLDRSHTYLHGAEGLGMYSWDTAGISHLYTGAAPVHAVFLDVWLWLNSGASGYVFTLSHYGDSGAQIRASLGPNTDLAWAQRIWPNGQLYLFSDTTSMASAYGYLRVLGFEE